jgi:hypothetical protein
MEREKLIASQFRVGMKMPLYDKDLNMTVRTIAKIVEGTKGGPREGDRLVTFTDGTQTILEGTSDRGVTLYHWRVVKE